MFRDVNDTFATRQLVTVVTSVKYRARESTTYCLISSPSWTLISFWRRQKCPNIRRCGCRVAEGGGPGPPALGSGSHAHHPLCAEELPTRAASATVI